MSASVQAGQPAKTDWRRIARVLRAELAFFPGRTSLILRMVLSCTCVMMYIMIFRIPGAALGAYYPLLLSRENPRATLRSATLTASICILGTAEIIVGAMLFSASPFLHLLWVVANLFAVFYLISSLSMYDVALALGLLITNAIMTWDLPLSAEMRLRQTLFTLLSIVVGCAISVAIEYLFAQTHPPDIVVDGIRQRLGLSARLLRRTGSGEFATLKMRTELSRTATRGTGALRDQLAHSSYEVGDRERLSAALALSGRIVELAASLAELRPITTQEDRARCLLIAKHLDEIGVFLQRDEAPDWLDLPADEDTTLPLLAEIERCANLAGQSFFDDEHPSHHHLSHSGKPRPLLLFKPGPFFRKEHLRFSIRGSLSALACYLFYMSVGWTGLSASIATCILTALTLTGASRHKQLLRFAGIIFGACVLGFGTQALILPQIDSLLPFALLFAFVISIGSWIGTSSPRIAYCGIQIVLAYDLVNLNRFAINTSLIPARDTVLGVLLGIGAMWLIFDHLWTTPSTTAARSLFIATLRETAHLGVGIATPAPHSAHQGLFTECERINQSFDKLRGILDFGLFEAFPKSDEEILLARCIRALLPQLRSLMLVKAGLMHHGLSAPDDRSPKAQSAVSAMLLHIAAWVNTNNLQPDFHQTPEHRALRLEIQSLQKIETDETGDVTGRRLRFSLLDLANHLESSAILSLTVQE